MSSCFAHGINSWAISHVSGVLPTVYSGVQVIFTVILADIFLDEGAFYKIVSDWSPYDRVGEVDAVP
jgi:succinate dehydrogenase hydrophobic anchor subunit